MYSINGTGNSYVDLVQTATRRNTITQIAEAKESGTAVDVEQIQSSNQEIRDNARSVGADIYYQQTQKQALDTYINVSSQYNNNSSSEKASAESNSDIYSYDAKKVNDAMQTAQKRAFAISVYDNIGSGDGFNPKPSVLPVSVYV